jgi:hypothetical protein
MSETIENTTGPKVPEIGIVDLQNVVQIIDAAAERGAFRGNELASVGSVRDRIDAFVKAVTPEMPPADTLASTAPEVASGTYDEVVSTVAEPAYTASTKKKNKKSN